MKFVLRNDFHNTEVVLNAKVNSSGDAYLSKGQVVKAWKTLCGIKECICCNEAGMRGYDNPGVEFFPDGSAMIRGCE